MERILLFKKTRIELTNVLMILSSAVLLSTIFLLPDCSNLIKYISRAALLISFLLYGFVHRISFPKWYFSWASILSVLLLFNVFFAFNRQEAFSTFLITIQAIWIAFVIATWLMHSKETKLIFIIIIVLSLFYCARLFQFIGLINWGTRKIGTMLGTNVNAIGMRLSFSCILALFFFFSTKRPLKYIYLIAFAIFIGFILITASRRALIIVMVSFLIFLFKTTKSLKNVIRTLLIGFSFFLIVYLLVTKIPQLYSVIGSRLKLLLHNLFSGEGSLDGADKDRLQMISKGFELFFERPFTGWGMGNFRYVSGIDHEYSHNNFIELLSATGIFVFVAYYMFFYKVIKMMIKSEKQRIEYVLCLSFIVSSIIADLVAPNYTSLIAHLMISFPYVLLANRESFSKQAKSKYVDRV